MQSGCRVGPVGASFSAGCLSMPLWGVRGAPAGQAGAHRMVRSGGSALRLGQAGSSQFLERDGVARGRVCAQARAAVGWDLLPPCERFVFWSGPAGDTPAGFSLRGA